MPTVLTLTDDPKCFKATVGDITRLDLSSRDLKFQDLKALGLSRFPRLEQLDVSDNNLTSFPENLPLQHLRKLNCSNNRLKDVTFLKQFPKLEEISIEMNLVNVNEEYIAVHMLPDLVLYNGRSTQYARKMTTGYENKLSAKLHRIWKDKYEDLYAGISSLLESARIEKALKRRLQDVPYGPASLQHLKDYLVGLTNSSSLNQELAF
ncbi:leucine-rich repeat and WD repeat-containing protein 1-like [Glandiceps talaboti]